MLTRAGRGVRTPDLVHALTVKHGVEVRAHRCQHHLVGMNGIDANLKYHVT
jgi:hypothetical protein